MTTPDLYEKCLVKVDAEIANVQVWLDAEGSWTSQGAIDDANNHLRFMLALRAVVEIHRTDKDGWCDNCWDSIGSPVLFPCPTITAIAKELGATP